jgi:hypothetical protein
MDEPMTDAELAEIEAGIAWCCGRNLERAPGRCTQDDEVWRCPQILRLLAEIRRLRGH